MSSIEMLPASREFAVQRAPRLRAGHTRREPTGGGVVGRGSRALRELRVVIGFVVGLIAFFVGVIVLLICWYAYKIRKRRV